MMVYLQMIGTDRERSDFETLYLTYKNLMLHAAFQILRNRDDAEDAVHQAFVTLAQNIRLIDFSNSDKLKSFVVTVAENKAIDLRRKRNRLRSAEEIGNLPGLAPDPMPDHSLAACILRLPARYREVVLLRYRHGYSHEEIGRLLGITRANAYKLDQRAKKKLEQLCREEGIL